MYPNEYDPYKLLQLAAMTPAGNPPMLPTMTPATSYFGPMHKALKDAFTASLARPNNGGLLSPVTPEQMGLLTSNQLPVVGSYYRMPSDFSSPASTPISPTLVKQAMENFTRNVANEGGGGRERPDQPVYSNDFTSSNGPVYNANGYSGPYDNGGGPGNTFNDGSLLGGIGSFFASLFTPKIQSSSIDATGEDTKSAAPAPSMPDRIPSTPALPSGPMADAAYSRIYSTPITGTPLDAPFQSSIAARPDYVGGPYRLDSSYASPIVSRPSYVGQNAFTNAMDTSYSLPADLQEARSRASAANALAVNNQEIRNAFGSDVNNPTVNGMMGILGPRGVDPIAQQMANRLPDSFSQPLITASLLTSPPVATTAFGNGIVPAGIFSGGGGGGGRDTSWDQAGLYSEPAGPSMADFAGWGGGDGAGGWGSDGGGGRGD